MSWMRKPWMKWAMPIGALVLTAALVTGGLAMTGGAAVSEGDDWDVDFTDINPAYASTTVIPSEALPQVLWSIEVSPEATAVSAGGGDLLEVVVENLIEEPLINDGANVLLNGDLIGDVVVSANIHLPSPFVTGAAPPFPQAGIYVYNVVPIIVPVNPTPTVVATFAGLTVHPGRTITMTVPVVATAGSTPGTIIVYDAVFNLTAGP